MHKKFIKFLIWLVIFNIAIVGGMLSSLKQAKAEVLPTLKFDQYYTVGLETVSNVKIKVDLSKVSNQAVSVNYAVVGGSATVNTDYTLDDNSLVIPAGNLSANINLNIIDNLTCEADKTIDMALSDPVNAELGSQKIFTYKILETDCNPKTTLVINPAASDGQNNWYVTTPSITLTTVEQLQTYYQWDSKNIDGWFKYSGSILAPEGNHILYYYSEKYDQKEVIHAANIKVDLTAPAAPIVTTNIVTTNIDSGGVVTLSWQAVNDATSYQIWRTDTNQVVATLSKDQLSIIDNTAIQGQSYTYNIVAIDEAGNFSDIAKVELSVPAKEVVVPVSVIITSETQPLKVTKSISDGVSSKKVETVSQDTTPQIAGTTDTTPVVENNSPTPSRNWNQILLAISILIIAIGAAIGGYYGYEWWMSHRDEPPQDSPKSKSRW